MHSPASGEERAVVVLASHVGSVAPGDVAGPSSRVQNCMLTSNVNNFLSDLEVQQLSGDRFKLVESTGSHVSWLQDIFLVFMLHARKDPHILLKLMVVSSSSLTDIPVV